MDVSKVGGALSGALTGGAEKTSAGGDFGSLLEGTIKKVDGLQKDADKAVEGLATGEVSDVHEVMLAMTKADLSFRMMLEVRNKLVEAYQEVSRMQV